MQRLRHPAWLMRDEDGELVPDPQHVKAIKQIFSLCLAGASTYTIAEILNDTDTPTLGRCKVWTQSTVSRIITHKHADLIVSSDTFKDAKTARARVKGQTKEKAKTRSKVKGTGIAVNIFRGVIFCDQCDSYVKIQPRKNGEHFLQCNNALRKYKGYKRCDAEKVMLAEFEDRALRFLTDELLPQFEELDPSAKIIKHLNKIQKLWAKLWEYTLEERCILRVNKNSKYGILLMQLQIELFPVVKQVRFSPRQSGQGQIGQMLIGDEYWEF